MCLSFGTKSGVLRRDPRVFTRQIICELHRQIFFHLTRLLNFFYLMSEKIEVWCDFATERLGFVDIDTCFFELPLALRFFVLIELEAERVFHHLAALFWRSIQDAVGFALRNNLIARAADIGACQKPDHVFEPHLRAIQEVFILTVAIHHALNDHFRKIDIEKTFRVIKNQFYARAILPRQCRRAPPDHVLSLFAAHRFHRLLTEDKPETIGHIALAAAIWSHDRSNGRSEDELRLFAK